MLSRRQIPPLLSVSPLLIVPLLASLALLAVTPARADAPAPTQENVLRGPHPFLKDNELSAHLLLAEGLGDSWSGTKLGLDYGYHLSGPVWLNLQLNIQKGACSLTPGQCIRSGSVAETLAGGKWKFSTQTPLVPYAKAATGLIYLFPEEARSAVGIAIRGGGGLEYFVFDWLGFGVEVNLSLGHGFFDSSYMAGHGYAIIDIGGGVEFQFDTGSIRKVPTLPPPSR